MRGKRWIAGSSDHGCWLGSYERDKRLMMEKTFRPGDVLYDLGANVGWYTLLGNVLGATHVYSFEPLPSNIAILRDHLRLNRVENCTVFEAAVGRSEGMARLAMGPSNSTGHLCQTATAQTIEVSIVTIDGLIRSSGLRPPNVIKCDIEGAELDALQGARHTLEQFGPTILLATHSRNLHAECTDYLRAIGYSTAPIPGTPVEDEMIAWRSGAATPW
jgi:FkbM family methyltransferase